MVEFKEKHRAGKLPATASRRGRETESQHRGRHVVAGSHTQRKPWEKSQEAQRTEDFKGSVGSSQHPEEKDKKKEPLCLSDSARWETSGLLKGPHEEVGMLGKKKLII